MVRYLWLWNALRRVPFLVYLTVHVGNGFLYISYVPDVPENALQFLFGGIRFGWVVERRRGA